MALFDFGKKKEIPPMQDAPQSLPVTPIDAVIQMRTQGLSNNQIIQNLQRQGFDTNQIFDAINQADVKGSVEAVAQGDIQQMPPLDNPIPEHNPYAQYQQAAQYSGGYHQPGTEEMIESIVHEKWEALAKDLRKFDEWKEKNDVAVAKLQQQVQEIKNDFDKLHQALLGKITEYDQNILNVGTEIKAMEKIFQKVLPTFTENLNELSRVTKNLKTK